MARNKLPAQRQDEILRLVQDECARAIGFDGLNSGDLTAQREKALQYVKGEMPDLVMELAGRSKVVSTDVADAIETALPDLIDIFTGGDDVVSFEPVGEEDVEAAQQEQEYLRHVLFNRNGGWRVVYEAFKDALTCKTGVFSWRWDGEFEPQPERHENVGIPVLIRCSQEGTVETWEPGEPDGDGQPTVSFDFVPKDTKGRIIVESIAPEDLAVAADTKSLATATYCAVRQRPRVQDLLAMGYDAEKVEALPPWNQGNQAEDAARDTVGETSVTGDASDPLKQVEIYRHYIRLYDEQEERWCLYQLVTGGQQPADILLDIEEVSRVQLAAITPYINPHRFYGDSVADKLLEIQKIKTAVQRLTLDSAFFAVNGRHEVDINGMTPDTLGDLLNNVPGAPVRVKRTGTIVPLSNGGLPYDPLAYLEYFETVAEKRTGIVRNAQGLNPDTLHDTKGGMEILQVTSQKRMRLIARIFAETGYKDFLVNLHATIRENGASMRDTVRLRGKWIEVDPSTWRQRDDMVIEIGVGAGGREHDIMVGQMIGQVQEKLLEAQNAPDGPLVKKQNLYRTAVYVLARMGVKAPENYISDPAEYQAPPQAPPPPDPQLMKVQLDAEKAQADDAFKREQMEREIELKDAEIAANIELERYKIDKEFELRLMEMRLRYASGGGEAGGARNMSLGSDDDGVDATVHMGGAPG